MKNPIVIVAAGAALALAAAAQAQAPSQTDPVAPRAGAGSVQRTAMLSARSLPANKVREIQQALKDRGIYKGEVNGVWGPATAAALHEFVATQDSQSGIRQGRPPDQIDPKALTALLPPPDRQAAPGAPVDPRRGSVGRPPSVSPGGPPSGNRLTSPPGTRP